jgi:hypothetical protein|tara:strand:+ start:42284 stop:42550 length:267 start_codon:yes stop_codon:yes gene_type:complete
MHFGGFVYLPRFSLNLRLGTNEKNIQTACNNLTNEVASAEDSLDGQAQINDVNPVAGTMNIWLHFGVPSANAAPDVGSGINELLYGEI